MGLKILLTIIIDPILRKHDAKSIHNLLVNKTSVKFRNDEFGSYTTLLFDPVDGRCKFLPPNSFMLMSHTINDVGGIGAIPDTK